MTGAHCKKRWLYALGGFLILLFSGLVYAWSVLAEPIAAEFPQWGRTAISFTFTLLMISFCIGCIAGGLLLRRVRPQLLILAAAVLFAAGFYAASWAQSILALDLSFAVACGCAAGLAYNAAMSTVTRWFPNHQGMISGLLLMGFGIGTFVVGKIYQSVTPEEIGAWRGSFRLLGGAVAAVLLLCAPLIRPAPEEKGKKHGENGAEGSTPQQMLRSRNFWLFYAWAVVMSMSGLALVSQAAGIVKEANSAVSAGTVATCVGLISLCNGGGRVFAGWCHDRLGSRAAMLLPCLLEILAAAALFMALRLQSDVLVLLGFVLGGVAYGGVTPANAAFIARQFGMRHYPENFSLVNTNLLLASFGSAIAGALYESTASYLTTTGMMLLCAVVALLLLFGIRPRACPSKTCPRGTD